MENKDKINNEPLRPDLSRPVGRPKRNDPELSESDDDSLEEKENRKGRVGIAGALIGGTFNACLIAAIVTVPSWNLPFIGPTFAAITLALMAGPIGNIMSAFMRTSYVSHGTRHLARMIESIGGGVGLAAIWMSYPFNFTAIGAPAAIDHWTPLACGVLAIFAGISAFVNFVKLLRGPRQPKRERDLLDR